MRRSLPTAPLLLVLAACGPGANVPNAATGEGNTTGSSVPPVGNGQALAAPETAATGRQYAALAGAGDLFEIEAARLARQKARRPEVRAFAAMLIADHQRSTAELGRAAAQARPRVPVAPALDAAQQADLETLRGAGGAVFDIVWLRQQVNAHERALTLVTAYATGGESEPLRRHAAAVAEPIRRHLARARELEVPPPR